MSPSVNRYKVVGVGAEAGSCIITIFSRFSLLSQRCRRHLSANDPEFIIPISRQSQGVRGRLFSSDRWINGSMESMDKSQTQAKKILSWTDSASKSSAETDGRSWVATLYDLFSIPFLLPFI